jgi:hypothetical protein
MDVAIARAIHVLAVVVWIGGVGMVTLIVLPLARRSADFSFFEKIERRFAPQARVAVVIAGLSGLHILWRFELWDRFRDPAYWWMHAMVGVWLLFSFFLFVAEPFAEAWLRRRAATDPQGALMLLARFHWVMLVLSAVTILGAVAGSHGVLFFE